MKICLVGDEFHTDGHTDGQLGLNFLVAFCNFAKAPENSNFTHFVKPNICVGTVGFFISVVVVVVVVVVVAFVC